MSERGGKQTLTDGDYNSQSAVLSLTTYNGVRRMRQLVKVACLAIVVFGIVVFTLIMSNLIEPAPWTGAAVTAVLPALILAGILLGNDKLRRHGFSEAQIPTTKENLAPSMVKTFVFGLAAGSLGIVAIYFLWK